MTLMFLDTSLWCQFLSHNTAFRWSFLILWLAKSLLPLEHSHRMPLSYPSRSKSVLEVTVAIGWPLCTSRYFVYSQVHIFTLLAFSLLNNNSLGFFLVFFFIFNIWDSSYFFFLVFFFSILFFLVFPALPLVNTCHVKGALQKFVCSGLR